MSEPELVYIGPHDVEIVWDSKELLERNQEDNIDGYGLSDFNKMRILVDERCPATRRREVVLHEIFHFVIWAFAVSLPVNEEVKYPHNMNAEEMFIQQFTGPMLLVMYQNPDLFQWMLERERNHG